MDSNEKSFKVLVIAPKGMKHARAPLLHDANIVLDSARFADISVVLSTQGPEVYSKRKSIAHYNFAWLQAASLSKDIAYMLSLYFDSIGIPHTSPEIEISKFVDMFSLSLHNVSIPKTYYCSRPRMAKRQEYIAKELRYPFLLKSTVGLGGNDVHIVHNAEEFLDLVRILPKRKTYLCQEFIPNQFDYRLLVGNGVVLSGEKRVRQNDLYRNNVAQGALEFFLEIDDIPQEVKDLAIKAAEVTHVQWAGVDIVTDEKNGKHYVLEVNRRPGLTKGSSEIQAAITFLKDVKTKYKRLSRRVSSLQRLASLLP